MTRASARPGSAGNCENYIDGLSASVLWHRGRCLAYGDGVAFSALTARCAAGSARPRTIREAVVRDEAGRHPSSDTSPTRPSGRGCCPRLLNLLGLSGAPSGMTREDLFSAWLTWFERLSQSERRSGRVGGRRRALRRRRTAGLRRTRRHRRPGRRCSSCCSPARNCSPPIQPRRAAPGEGDRSGDAVPRGHRGAARRPRRGTAHRCAQRVGRPGRGQSAVRHRDRARDARPGSDGRGPDPPTRCGAARRRASTPQRSARSPHRPACKCSWRAGSTCCPRANGSCSRPVRCWGTRSPARSAGGHRPRRRRGHRGAARTDRTRPAHMVTDRLVQRRGAVRVRPVGRPHRRLPDPVEARPARTSPRRAAAPRTARRDRQRAQYRHLTASAGRVRAHRRQRPAAAALPPTRRAGSDVPPGAQQRSGLLRRPSAPTWRRSSSSTTRSRKRTCASPRRTRPPCSATTR